uniref:Large ribosomal subunit protein uL24c n=1 Tax=Strombidium rassoulzadegani TaxID=1082188 RepID=A0A7S3CQB3_9SPIT|mmetsp:Transcript_17982/g.30606  ORF Transcript_17982/g.30606 Transcript_17982/m.30606 type:complete len:216 (+) Transcript_17982:26-673(+)
MLMRSQRGLLMGLNSAMHQSASNPVASMLAGQMPMRSFAWTPIQKPFKHWHIVRGDFVIMNSGKQRNHVGKVLKVLRKKNQVLVEGVNYKYIQVDDEEMVRRKKTAQKEFPVHISNVNLVDPQSNQPTRVRIGFTEEGEKVRVAKKSGLIIPKPERVELKFINRIKDRAVTPLDTPVDEVLKKTYTGEDFVSIYNEFSEFIYKKEEKEKFLVFDK